MRWAGLFMSAQTILLGVAASQPTALVYKSSKTLCDGCAEALKHLLETSPSKFSVSYVGPDADVPLSKAALSTAEVFAIGGGPDIDGMSDELKSNAQNIRDWVTNGGRYLGFCLGAFVAGTDPGLGILPQGAQTDEEITQPNAQVKNQDDTVIQVDWTFATGSQAGVTKRKAWLYFQDGVVVDLPSDSPNVTILARYSSNGDVASSISPFGKGWVGLVGPHPEATEDWYEAEGISNPDGVSLEYGWDFVEATYNAGR